jgi:23S rRNA G2069 N7-methylase RlmK/C1962 C5-methylase RlmI
VTSIDISETAIKDSKEYAKEMGVEEKYQAIKGDVFEYEFKEKYDMIILSFTQFTKKHAEFHQKVISLLSEKGILMGAQYSPKHLLNKCIVRIINK